MWYKTSQQSLIGVAAGEMEHDTTHGHHDACRNLEKLEPDGADLGSGEFGALQAFAT